ncbi:MAG: YggT family protein [Fibrobacterota bacterium]
MSVTKIIYMALQLYEVLLIIRIVMSWIRPDPYHPIVQWIYKLTDPVLEPIRRLLPIQGMGIDFSPIVVFILINILKRLVIGSSFGMF